MLLVGNTRCSMMYAYQVLLIGKRQVFYTIKCTNFTIKSVFIIIKSCLVYHI